MKDEGWPEWLLASSGLRSPPADPPLTTNH